MAAVWKPKVKLDKPLLERMGKYYKHKFNSEIVNLECFSHPDLEHHECNPSAKLPGEVDCKICRHVLGRVCQITCHISQFCLLMFAYRLGIGGEDFDTAFEINSQMSYEDLSNVVTKRLLEIKRGSVSEKPIPKKVIEVVPEFNLAEEIANDYVDETAEAISGGEWLTIKEAAEFYGSTYANIFSHVSKGNLPHRIFGGVKKVSKGDLLEMKSRNKKGV